METKGDNQVVDPHKKEVRPWSAKRLSIPTGLGESRVVSVLSPTVFSPMADRYGLSFYSYDVICSYLELCVDDYIEARDGLIKKDLIAYDGTLFQVLDLPESPVQAPPMKAVPASTGRGHRSEIQALIQQSLWGAEGDR